MKLECPRCGRNTVMVEAIKINKIEIMVSAANCKNCMKIWKATSGRVFTKVIQDAYKNYKRDRV